MAKIPGDLQRFIQTNQSDKFGNIHYSRNIDLDEEGYLKLSPRAFSLTNSSDDTDFGLPTALGRDNANKFNIATRDQAMEVTISENTISSAIDNGSSRPTLGADSHGRYWQNRWYVTTNTGLFYKTTGNWTDASVSLTTGKMHTLEVFKSRETMCITNGNSVKQINTSHATTNLSALSIPADFEATKLAYNNNRMAVATRLSDSFAGQNGEAYLFLWDGTTASANLGIAAGTDWIIDIVPYKMGFAFVTRTGELLHTGVSGGLQTLAQLPIYFTDRVWGDAQNGEGFGDLLAVEGDVIYVNVNNTATSYGYKKEIYQPEAPGGVLCFDPKVGVYHRYSPSISPVNMVKVNAGGIDVSTDVFTAASGTIYATGNPVKYLDTTSSPNITGIQKGKVYYCIKVSASTFKLATTYANAIAGTAIDITAQAGGESRFLFANFLDYGQVYTNRTGAVAVVAQPDNALNSVVFGSELYPTDGTAQDAHLSFISTGFPNVGYFVTSRIPSAGVTDVHQTGLVRFRGMQSGDSIKIKVKTRDIFNIPVSTPQDGVSCTWRETNKIRTTADLSEVESYINDSNGVCELEVIAGAGGGQMSQISSIEYIDSIATYEITLTDTLLGVAQGDACEIAIDNWKELVTITETDVNVKEFAIGEETAGAQYKVILSGVNVIIEELQILNATQQQLV